MCSQEAKRGNILNTLSSASFFVVVIVIQDPTPQNGVTHFIMDLSTSFSLINIFPHKHGQKVTFIKTIHDKWPGSLSSRWAQILSQWHCTSNVSITWGLEALLRSVESNTVFPQQIPQASWMHAKVWETLVQVICSLCWKCHWKFQHMFLLEASTFP